MSNIEWTEATWNPISGCSRKSAGCENCYAEVMTKRLEAMGLPKYQGLLNEQGRFNGVVRLDEDALTIPLKRKTPTTYFVNSMSDLFHGNVPDEWIDKVFAVMALCPQHVFQVLTKRADRMRAYCDFTHPGNERVIAIRQATAPFSAFCTDKTSAIRFPLPNVWLGVSAENQKTADERIPLLLDTSAAVRFVTVEPLLEGIILPGLHCGSCLDRQVHWCADPVIDWVIVGGESGPNARPCNVDWIRSIVAQCKAADVPVLVKQLGSKCVTQHPMDVTALVHCKFADKKGGDMSEWPQDLCVRELPKVREAGNKLEEALEEEVTA